MLDSKKMSIVFKETEMGFLSKLLQRFTLLFHTPTWNNSKEIDEICETLNKESVEELGTASDAVKTLEECRRRFIPSQLRYRVGFFTGKEYDELTEIDDILRKSSVKGRLLGHTRHVSYFGTNAIRLGYVKRKHPSGYVLERLETLNSGLVVLRLHGKMISAYPLSIHRMESNGRMTVC